jgi:hypothetical protein
MRWGWERLAALAGVVAVALWVIGVLIQESTDMPGDEPTGEQVLAWYSGEENAILASGFVFMLGALMLVIVGLLFIKTRVLPAWVGWASLVLALVMLIPPIGWAGLLLGFPLWTVLVSVLLWMRPAAELSPPPTASQL